MSPWWLRPPADEDKDAEPEVPAAISDSLHVAPPARPAVPPGNNPVLPETLDSAGAEEAELETGDTADAADASDAEDETEASGETEGDETPATRSRRRGRRRGGRGRGTTNGSGTSAAAPEPEAPARVEFPARRSVLDPAARRFEATPEGEERLPERRAWEYRPDVYLGMPERPAAASEVRKIALFCDFENIALGVRDSEIKKFDIDLVIERILEKGKIIVKKAYADWERYSEFKRALHEAAIELIDIPQKHYSGKNSADIKMVVDAMDLSYSKEHLDTFVIMSGDSDFSPLVSKLKENNKYVIGVGVKGSSSSLLIDNCDEFIYYEDVWRSQQAVPQLSGVTAKTAPAFELMLDAILALQRENKDVLWGSMVKQTMQRKKPSFNEGYYGYSTFSELLEDAERQGIVKLKKDQRSGTYVVTLAARRPAERAPGR